ncbi:MAG: NADH-quinone oxidoreductase subunit A [Bryobacteraceae bacterium]
MDGPLWPLAIYTAAVVLMIAAILAISWLLGQRHSERATGSPYEAGIVGAGSARVRLSARFYLVAMFFVIFDLEAVFLFAWAVAAADVGWAGYIEAAIFIGVLVAALVYLVRIGALDWSGTGRRTQ